MIERKLPEASIVVMAILHISRNACIQTSAALCGGGEAAPAAHVRTYVCAWEERRRKRRRRSYGWIGPSQSHNAIAMERRRKEDREKKRKNRSCYRQDGCQGAFLFPSSFFFPRPFFPRPFKKKAEEEEGRCNLGPSAVHARPQGQSAFWEKRNENEKENSSLIEPRASLASYVDELGALCVCELYIEEKGALLLLLRSRYKQIYY